MAKENKAYLICLEHRYYGDSCPFKDFSTEHLKYLTSQQALADAATFLEYFINVKKKSDKIRKVIVIGGSYTGAMSAWFRMLYPNLVIGSLASSAPVYLEEEFTKYDEHIALSLPEECQKKVKEANDEIDASVSNETELQNMKERTRCLDIADSVDWRYALADAVSWAVQYNRYEGSEDQRTIEKLCNIMNQTSETKTAKDCLFDFFAEALRINDNTTCLEFSSAREKLKREEFDVYSSSRQWYYQSCKEFGYFQVVSHNKSRSIRSESIDLQYHRDLCKDVFGIDVDISESKKLYMQENMIGTNILWTNGEVDPWMELSITPNEEEEDSSSSSSFHHKRNVPVTKDGREERQNWVLLLIKNGSHCSDLSSPSDTDSDSLKEARETIRETIKEWVKKSASGNGKYNTKSPLFITCILFFIATFIFILLGIVFVIIACLDSKRTETFMQPINQDSVYVESKMGYQRKEYKF